MKNYNSIDLMKFVMALCVVTIHTFFVENMEPSIFRDFLHSLICSAVPFFFIVSAFFAMRCKDSVSFWKYWKRILWLYLSWGIINFVGYSIIEQNLTLEKVQNATFDLLTNGYSVLWYMWGILVVLPILRIIRYGGASPKIYLVIALCMYLFNRGYTHYGSMENPGTIWSWAVFLYQGKYFGITNFCIAMTYLSIGTFFMQSEFRPSKKICWLLIIVGVVEMHFEKYKGVALGVPVIAFGLFSLVEKWHLNCNWMSFRWLRKMSTLIYFIHGVVIVGISQVVSGKGMCELVIWSIIILCCIVISALLLKLSKMKGLQWIAKLY